MESIKERTTRRSAPAVTPAAIADAKRRAIEACAAAYSAQEVRQPDGSSLSLCWKGRIARGYEKLASSRLARDERGIEVMTEAIAGLSNRYTAAVKVAEDTASAWAAMCAAVGAACDPLEVYPPPCACDGCRMQTAHQDKAAARAHYVRALYALLAPNAHDIPPIMELGRKIQDGDPDAKRRMNEHLQRIYEAGERYANAHAAAGTSPNWRQLWPDEESA